MTVRSFLRGKVDDPCSGLFIGSRRDLHSKLNQCRRDCRSRRRPAPDTRLVWRPLQDHMTIHKRRKSQLLRRRDVLRPRDRVVRIT